MCVCVFIEVLCLFSQDGAVSSQLQEAELEDVGGGESEQPLSWPNDSATDGSWPNNTAPPVRASLLSSIELNTPAPPTLTCRAAIRFLSITPCVHRFFSAGLSVPERCPPR